NPDATIDRGRTAALVALARPMAVTFHKAFDESRDPFEALDDLIGLGIDRILTSGRQPSALEGRDLIAQLVRRADDRITIMAGGGLTESHLRTFLESTRVRE